MKNSLRKLCFPILNHFESAEGDFVYKASHRKILIAVGLLFLGISIISGYLAISSANYGGLLPFAIFFAVGFVCQIVGWLGNDKAVAKIWNSRK